MTQAIEAMLKVMGEVRTLSKDRRNQQQNFKFRGIDDLMNLVGPALRNHGVIVSPTIVSIEHGQIQGRNGLLGHTVLHMRYTFHAADGSEFTIEGIGESSDAGDKSVSKAMAMAYKYALFQALCLPTDDPDPDSEIHERAEAPDPAEVDEAKAVRDQIADWANKNGRTLPDIAAQYAERSGGRPITQAHPDDLRTFYAELSLGGKTVDQQEALPEEAQGAPQ